MAGAIAGLAGSLIVQGRDHSLLQDFSANLGFLGIGVALVARLHPALDHCLGRCSSPFSELARTAFKRAPGLSPVVGEIVIATFVDPPDGHQVIKFRYPESVDAH